MKVNLETVKDNITKKLEEAIQKYNHKKVISVVDICNIANFCGCKSDDLLADAIEDDEEI